MRANSVARVIATAITRFFAKAVLETELQDDAQRAFLHLTHLADCANRGNWLEVKITFALMIADFIQNSLVVRRLIHGLKLWLSKKN